ncbi:hypothetical protein M758_N007100 [Ceratodon purpureus]|nr:hypothetical protein M758_N007100 [Ceratodon purpureus]
MECGENQVSGLLKFQYSRSKLVDVEFDYLLGVFPALDPARNADQIWIKFSKLDLTRVCELLNQFLAVSSVPYLGLHWVRQSSGKQLTVQVINVAMWRHLLLMMNWMPVSHANN